MNCWHPEHEDEGRYRWPRLAKWWDRAVITVAVLAVIAAGTAAWVVVKLFPWGL